MNGMQNDEFGMINEGICGCVSLKTVGRGALPPVFFIHHSAFIIRLRL